MPYNAKTAQINKQRDHEIRLKLLSLIEQDPEMKYFLGVVGGAALGSLGWMADFLTPSGTKVTKSEFGVEGGQIGPAPPPGWVKDETGTHPPEGGYWDMSEAERAWFWLSPIDSPLSLIGGLTAASKNPFTGIGLVALGTEKVTSGDLTDSVNDVLKIGGVGFSAWCASILMLKAMSGEQGLSSLLPVPGV